MLVMKTNMPEWGSPLVPRSGACACVRARACMCMVVETLFRRSSCMRRARALGSCLRHASDLHGVPAV